LINCKNVCLIWICILFSLININIYFNSIRTKRITEDDKAQIKCMCVGSSLFLKTSDKLIPPVSKMKSWSLYNEVIENTDAVRSLLCSNGIRQIITLSTMFSWSLGKQPFVYRKTDYFILIFLKRDFLSILEKISSYSFLSFESMTFQKYDSSLLDPLKIKLYKS